MLVFDVEKQLDDFDIDLERLNGLVLRLVVGMSWTGWGSVLDVGRSRRSGLAGRGAELCAAAEKVGQSEITASNQAARPAWQM